MRGNNGLVSSYKAKSCNRTFYLYIEGDVTDGH